MENGRDDTPYSELGREHHAGSMRRWSQQQSPPSLHAKHAKIFFDRVEDIAGVFVGMRDGDRKFLVWDIDESVGTGCLE